MYTTVYPLYLAIEGLCLYSLIGLLTGIDVAAFGKRASERMPVRLIAAVLGMALLFAPIWLAMMAQGIAAQKAPAAATVFVMDLCFMIPAMVYAAVQIWRRRPVGYLLSGVIRTSADRYDLCARRAHLW